MIKFNSLLLTFPFINTSGFDCIHHLVHLFFKLQISSSVWVTKMGTEQNNPVIQRISYFRRDFHYILYFHFCMLTEFTNTHVENDTDRDVLPFSEVNLFPYSVFPKSNKHPMKKIIKMQYGNVCSPLKNSIITHSQTKS